MTSLVTGATGFVGSFLAASLADRGRPVRALYRDGQKGQFLKGKAESVVGDVCDERVVRQAVSGTTVIYHCAAAHSTASTEEMRRTTMPSLRCLLGAMREATPAPRLILMSSINVLGNGNFQNATEELPRRRTKELHVDLKIEAEELAERAVADGLNIVSLRPGLIYGPGEPHLPKLAQAIKNGKFVFIGSRDNVIPLIHVTDMIEAMTLAGDSMLASGRTYNITDGSATTIGELVRELARAVNSPEPKRVLPKVVPRMANSVCGLLGKKGPVSSSALRFLGSSRHVDISRARKELGFNPKVKLADGIESIADWLRTTISAPAAA
jgi:nucleoside-diphosphate-sugar epimerase